MLSLSSFSWRAATHEYEEINLSQKYTRFTFDFLTAQKMEQPGIHNRDDGCSAICVEVANENNEEAYKMQYDICCRRLSVFFQKGRMVRDIQGRRVVNPKDPPSQLIMFETSEHNTTELDLSVGLSYHEVNQAEVGLHVSEWMLSKVFDYLAGSWIRVLEVSTSHNRLIVSTSPN